MSEPHESICSLVVNQDLVCFTGTWSPQMHGFLTKERFEARKAELNRLAPTVVRSKLFNVLNDMRKGVDGLKQTVLRFTEEDGVLWEVRRPFVMDEPSWGIGVGPGSGHKDNHLVTVNISVPRKKLMERGILSDLLVFKLHRISAHFVAQSEWIPHYSCYISRQLFEIRLAELNAAAKLFDIKTNLMGVSGNLQKPKQIAAYKAITDLVDALNAKDNEHHHLYWRYEERGMGPDAFVVLMTDPDSKFTVPAYSASA
ncbi:hypothetical protein BC830DRAFT_1171762 [Chytriomyces sp. MP71]|nr:hypothetical protein BC830DRAFT_1171762 [Chytriomyces sp. MP71]